MLKSKIHRATVTAASVDYEGSITIDRALMAAVDILEHEQVHVLDVDNGARVITYAIKGGPGEIQMNGAAARKIGVGDTVIILSYGEFEESEILAHRARIVKVNRDNEIVLSEASGDIVTVAAQRQERETKGE